MMHPMLMEGFSKPPDMLRRALVRDLEDKIEEVEDGLKRRRSESVIVSSESVDENFFDVSKLKDETEVVGEGLTRRKEAVDTGSGDNESEQELVDVLESAYRHARIYRAPKA